LHIIALYAVLLTYTNTITQLYAQCKRKVLFKNNNLAEKFIFIFL
jgi:hypothetical protein